MQEFIQFRTTDGQWVCGYINTGDANIEVIHVIDSHGIALVKMDEQDSMGVAFYPYNITNPYAAVNFITHNIVSIVETTVAEGEEKSQVQQEFEKHLAEMKKLKEEDEAANDGPSSNVFTLVPNKDKTE